MKVYLIVNTEANSGKAKGKILMVKKALYQQGHDVDVKEISNLEKDVEKAVADYMDSGSDVLLIGGGDGTVRYILNELVGKDIKVGIIPLGTSNVFAKEMGIPLSYRSAVALLKNGVPVKLDVGKVSLISEKSDAEKAIESIKKDRGENFLLMAGMGFDSAVLDAVSPSLREKHPELAYALATLQAAITYKYPMFALEIETPEGEVVKETSFFTVIANNSFYGGPYKLIPNSSMVDKLLDVVVFKEKGFMKIVKLLWALKKNKITEDPSLVFYKAKRVKATPVDAAKEIKIQLDGDAWNSLPAEFWVAPEGVEIYLPKKKAEEMLKSMDSYL
jgi:diacylglycerol kinase (ATP)